MVGCKSDRPREASEVNESEGEAFVREMGASFVVSSAINAEGTDEAVGEILEKIVLARLELEGAKRDKPALQSYSN